MTALAWVIDISLGHRSGSLSKETNTGLADPKIKARIDDLGGTPPQGSPAKFSMLIADETECVKLIKRAGIKAE